MPLYILRQKSDGLFVFIGGLGKSPTDFGGLDLVGVVSLGGFTCG